MSTSATGPIMLCYDRSDGARRAIEVAGALFPGREAVVLHVWSPIAVVAAAYGGIDIVFANATVNATIDPTTMRP